MRHTRLIRVGFLAIKLSVLVLAAASIEAPVQTEESSLRNGPPECDAATCASAALAVPVPPPPLANDRDGCKVVDFWTADLRDYYTLTGDAADAAIKLIELSVASEDP